MVVKEDREGRKKIRRRREEGASMVVSCHPRLMVPILSRMEIPPGTKTLVPGGNTTRD
jgi:hypothetical protein